MDLIRATVRLTDKVPALRVVLGHLQALQMPAEKADLNDCLNDLREMRSRKAWAKISWLPGYRSGFNGPLEQAVYKPGLDRLWETFGEDFLVYAGRNEPALDVLKTYMLQRGRSAAEKFFWKNSVSAYRWVSRDPKQPRLAAA